MPEQAPKEEESTGPQEPSIPQSKESPAKKVVCPKKIEALTRTNSLYTNHLD